MVAKEQGGTHDCHAVLEDLAEREDDGRDRDEVHAREIERERERRVGEECHEPHVCQALESLCSLEDRDDENVEPEADGREEVERHKWRHVVALKEDLDQRHACRLDKHGEQLDREPKLAEVRLAERGDRDAHRDDAYDDDWLPRERLCAKQERSGQEDDCRLCVGVSERGAGVGARADYVPGLNDLNMWMNDVGRSKYVQLYTFAYQHRAYP